MNTTILLPCEHEIDIEVDFGDHFYDIPRVCEECGYKLTDNEFDKLLTETEIDVMEHLTEYAMDSDR